MGPTVLTEARPALMCINCSAGGGLTMRSAITSPLLWLRRSARAKPRSALVVGTWRAICLELAEQVLRSISPHVLLAG